MTIAVVNDYPVIVAGVAAMLERDPRIRVVEYATRTTPTTPVDIALFDAFAGGTRLHDEVRVLLNANRVSKVAVYSWRADKTQVDELLSLGIHGFLGKSLSPTELTEALVKIHAGERVVQPPPLPRPASAGRVPSAAAGPGDNGDGWQIVEEETVLAEWPGQESGLSPRESEVVALITQGLTNEEIARSCYLSINSIKSYIRSAYRKMGVQRRSQAVLWGIEHGLLPDKERRVNPPE